MKKFNHIYFYNTINYILKEKFVKNKTELSSIFDISTSKLSEILNKRMNPGIELYQILVTKFNINAHWLLTGDGDMLQSDFSKKSEKPDCSHLDKVIQQKDKIIESLQEQNNQLLQMNKLQMTISQKKTRLITFY